MLANNAADRFEAQTSSIADALGSEERLENMLENLARNARSVIDDLDQHAIQFPCCADAQLAFPVHRVHGVIDEVRPHLVELAPMGTDPRQCAVEIELHLDSVLKAIPQHDQSILQA